MDNGSREVWVFIEQHSGRPADVSLELLTKGRKLAEKLRGPLKGILIGHEVDAVAKEAFRFGSGRTARSRSPRSARLPNTALQPHPLRARRGKAAESPLVRRHLHRARPRTTDRVELGEWPHSRLHGSANRRRDMEEAKASGPSASNSPRLWWQHRRDDHHAGCQGPDGHGSRRRDGDGAVGGAVRWEDHEDPLRAHRGGPARENRRTPSRREAKQLEGAPRLSSRVDMAWARRRPSTCCANLPTSLEPRSLEAARPSMPASFRASSRSGQTGLTVRPEALHRLWHLWCDPTRSGHAGCQPHHCNQ